MIQVETTVSAPLDKVWSCWNRPEDITQWNFAADSWCCPTAVNDLKTGGDFSYRMEAKDGSFGFDFKGTYTQVKEKEFIAFTMGDGRKVEVIFRPLEDGTVSVVEKFEPETENDVEMQKGGWQSILNNFKKHTESK
jgi:uncharacterized protein YndB with AHSA1/START domain